MEVEMIDIPGLKNLTAKQKGLIRKAIENAKQEAINDAHLDLRMIVEACRKPNPYDSSTMHIQDYFHAFEPFRRILQLQGNKAVNVFLTYMFRLETIKTLKPPLAGLQARLKLKKASQTMDETVAEFGKRLENLGKVGYPVGEEAAKDKALMDALAMGVRSDELGILLLSGSNKSFKDLLTQAINHEASCDVRNVTKSGNDWRKTAKQSSYCQNTKICLQRRGTASLETC